ncbi:O-antigen ligase family protein [Dysgonomonas reticulitermitis]
MLKRILNLILILPFILVLCTVFIVSHDLANGGVSGKYFWFFLSASLTSGSSFVLFLLNKKDVVFSYLDLFVVLFSISVCVVSCYNGDIITNKLVLLVLITILYFHFKVLFIQQKWALSLLVIFFIFTGFAEAIWGLKQLYGYSPSLHSLFRTTGSFFNPGPYAGYLAMILPLAFYHLLNDYKVFNKRINRSYLPFYFRWGVSAVTSLSILLVLPATMSRASWVATVTGCLIAFAFYFFKQKGKPKRLKNYMEKNKRKVFLIFTSIIVFVIISSLLLYHLKKDSADGRALIWKVCMETIKENPLGVGIGRFADNYGSMQAKYLMREDASEQEQFVAGNPEYAFNEYLQICIEFGIVPFLIFLAIIVYVIFNGMRNRQYASVSTFFALLVFAGMSYPFRMQPFLISFVFLVAACSGKRQPGSVSCKNIKVYCALGISTLIVSICLYNRYPMYNAYKKWDKSKTLYTNNLYTDVVKECKNIAPYLSHEVQFLFEYAQSLSKTGLYEESNTVLNRAMAISCDPMLYNIMGKNYQYLKNYNLAEEYFNKSARIVPSRLYPYYLLAKLYDEMGDKEKVCQMAEFIQLKEAKIHSMAVNEMREEMKSICEKYKIK